MQIVIISTVTTICQSLPQFRPIRIADQIDPLGQIGRLEMGVDLERGQGLVPGDGLQIGYGAAGAQVIGAEGVAQVMEAEFPQT